MNRLLILFCLSIFTIYATAPYVSAKESSEKVKDKDGNIDDGDNGKGNDDKVDASIPELKWVEKGVTLSIPSGVQVNDTVLLDGKKVIFLGLGDGGIIQLSINGQIDHFQGVPNVLLP